MRLFTMKCDQCGRQFSNSSEARVNFAHSRHSCDRTRVLAERSRRVQDRLEREGVERECFHERASHQHGTRTAYILDRCRCRECTEVNRAVEVKRKKQIAFGRYDTGRIDSSPTRAHITMLGEQGVSLKRLASLTGVSTATLGKIIYGVPKDGRGPSSGVLYETAEKILAVKPTLQNRARGALADATGARRRVQALVAIGYSLSEVGRHLSILPSNFGWVRQGDQVSVRTVLAVIDLYERLWNKPKIASNRFEQASITRARRLAASHGWPPPAAWDDDAIDHPEQGPANRASDELAKGRTKRIAESSAVVEDVEFLAEMGEGRLAIAARLEKPWETIERHLYRVERGDLVSLLKSRDAFGSTPRPLVA